MHLKRWGGPLKIVWYHQGINFIDDLTSKAKFYFNQHNNVIPLPIHKGGRPGEVYLSSWNEEEKQKIDEAKKLALLARKIKNHRKKSAM